MEQDTPMAEPQERSNLHFVEMRVYLFNPRTSPSLVNPDFLRHNEIVDPDWQLMRPVIMETDFSRVRYSNGVSLSANDSYVVVTQEANIEETDSGTTLITQLKPENLLCFDVAERFFEMGPSSSSYDTLSIDPVCLIEFPDTVERLVSSPFLEIAEQLQHGGITPVVEARLTYELPNKLVILYVTELMRSDSDALLRLRLRGEIVRTVEGDTLEEQHSFLKGVLSNWAEDLQDFEDLAYDVYSLYIQGEK